jgi:hypothetical protein
MCINYSSDVISSVISIRLSINIAVFNPNPSWVVTKQVFRLFTMARAMATLFAFLLKFLKVIFYVPTNATLFKTKSTRS